MCTCGGRIRSLPKTETIAKQVMYSSLWWPALHGDTRDFVKQCDVCQHSRVPTNLEMPMRPILSTRAGRGQIYNYNPSIPK